MTRSFPLSLVLALLVGSAGLVHAAAAVADQDVTKSLEDLRSRLQARDPKECRATYEKIAALNAKADPPLEAVTAVLAGGLHHQDLAVRTRVAELLDRHQDADVALKALGRAIDDSIKLFRKRESAYAKATTSYVGALIESLGRYRDDRAVKALISFYKKNKTNTNAELATRLVKSLGALGTRDALATIVDHLGTVEMFSRGKRSVGKVHHDTLVKAAAVLGIEDVPEFSANASMDWRRWLKKHSKAIPRKLGRVKTPSK